MIIKQLITNIIQRLKCFVNKSKPKATNSRDFTLDLLKIMPINSLCTINAPDLENQTLDSISEKIPNSNGIVVLLNEENKRILSVLIAENQIQDWFHSMTIHKDGKLCECFDSMLDNFLSKELDIPLWFKEKYEPNDDYCITDEW